MSPATRGAVVVLAGFGITVALGSLCVWVLIAAELLRPLSAGGIHGWTVSQVSLPFAVAAGSLVLATLVGGFVQDRIGPRWTATAGGVLIGLGMIVASMTEGRLAASSSLATFMVLGLGLMVGGGAGLAFASVVPPAVKWSVPRRRGLVVGLVLTGIALGPLWLNDAAQALVRERGFSSVLLVQGIVLLALIVALSQVLEDPLPGYVPPGSYSEDEDVDDGPVPWAGLSSRRMVGTRMYHALWAGSALLAGAIGLLSVWLLVTLRTAAASGYPLVIGVGLSAGLGCVLAGVLLDRAGHRGLRFVFLSLVFVMGAASVLGVVCYPAAAAILIAVSGGGGVVALWLSVLECFGTRHGGANFGLAFTGWCLGFLLGSLLALTSASMGPGGMAVPAARNLMFGVLVLILVGAAVLLAQVRPPSGREALHNGLSAGTTGRDS